MSSNPFQSPESEVYFEPLKPAQKYTQSALFAFFVTPFVGVACSLVIYILWLVPGLKEVLESDNVGILKGAGNRNIEALGMVLIYGLFYSIFTYLMLLIYGLPLHLLLDKFQVKASFAYILLGIIPGVVAFPFQLPFTFSSSRNYAISFVLYGGIVAYVFWYICVKPKVGINTNHEIT